MKDFLKIPEDRVGALIGRNRETLNKLEMETGTKIIIQGNEVEIEGEALPTLNAKNVITAVARGFSPEKAFKLLDENYILEVLDLTTSRRKPEVIKSRVIGAKGRTREIIEELTETYISVYGKTVSIIGTLQEVQEAKKAISMLIEGATHAAVYKYLESLQ